MTDSQFITRIVIAGFCVLLTLAAVVDFWPEISGLWRK
jgi:hypothetical protein